MNRLLQMTHELWLATLMGSFMSKDGENKRLLNEFSNIFYRHHNWIENDLFSKNIEYDYNRDNIPIKVDKLSVLLRNIIDRINQIELALYVCDDKELKARIEHDFEYIKYTLQNMPDEDISAFNMQRRYKDIELSKEATDALTLFLFEESYKEYELIMIYNYLKVHSSDCFINRIFDIMIQESFFHLRSFGEMMAEMGILGVPRVIHKSLYQVEDVVEFLKDGIEEEIGAKEQCKELSDAVAKDSVELAKFFDFINYQESYHIDLMKQALEYYTKKVADE